MKYFLHDTSAFEDEKITELFMEFGYEGLGLFYTVLEKLAKNEHPVKTAVLKKQLFVGKKLEKCWNFMEKIGILSSNNGETFNKQLLNFSENYKIKSEKNTKRISEWREKQRVTENVTRYESVRNSPKDKVKRSKENVLPPNPLKGESLETETFDLLENKEPQKRVARGAAVRMEEYRTWLVDLGFKEGPATDLVLEWLEYKTGRREYYSSQKTLSTFVERLRELSGGNFENAKTIVRTAIGNTSQGIYPLKNQSNGNSKGTKVTDEDLARIVLGDRFTPGGN
jgi:hypothetical protein